MSSNEQMSDAGESTPKSLKSNVSPKKTAFDWSLFDNRGQVLMELRQTQEFVDLMLVTEDNGKEVVHKDVVSALGKEFTDYINNGIEGEILLENGSTVNKVMIENISKPVLKIIVDCAYTGFVQTNTTQVWPLIEAAEIYHLNDVLDSSLTYLIRELNVENCIKVFNLGLKHRHKLSNASYAFIRTNFTKIVDKCIDFSNLGFNELISLIVDDELNIKTEKTVFNAIIRWISGDITARKDKLFHLLSKLRFARIELSFIDKQMIPNQLIREDKLCKDLVLKFCRDHRTLSRNGNGLYVALDPIAVRPRIPHEILLAFGGWQEGIPSTMLESYDIRTNLWFDTKLSNESPRAYHGIEVIDGLVYVIGGTNGTQILDTVQCFNPISKKWYGRHSMVERRCYVSTVSIDGIIYAMGGHNGRHRTKTCEKYDIIANEWTAFEEMNMIRSDASAAVHNNKIYIAGGLNDQMIENTVEVYNPLDKTWTFIQSMSVPRTSLGLVSYGNYIYAIGGNNGLERLQSVERYDFRHRNWFQMASMASKRSTFATAVIENQLFVIGGYNGQTPICSVERYDAKENIWTNMRNMKHDRSGLSVCLLKGLSNSSDYSYIGMNARNDKKRKIKIIDSKTRNVSEEHFD